MEAPFIDLINSRWSDWHGSGRRGDYLDDPTWIARFLSRWGLELPDGGVSQVRAALRDLRTTLDPEVRRAMAGDSLSDGGLERIGSLISAVRYRNRLAKSPRFAVNAEPERKDPAWVVARIAESFVDVLSRGDPRRLKTCANPDCGWLFYDDSPAQSRIWCDSRACGNLMKVRRFRARAKEKPTS